MNPAPEAAGQVPTCPRHPDRESYVRCQRCGRPACPECQRPAAVGIHCVDCVREASKTVRQGRTTFGGAVTDGRPLVTFWIIGICVAVYLLQTVQPSLTRDIAFAPVVGDTQPWRFITSGFAHGGLTHIAFNMYALFVMGQYLEPMLGRSRYIALYLLSAFGGSVGILLLASKPAGGVVTLADESWITAAVGASGAVFGLFGAFLVLQRRLGRSAAGMYVVIGINAAIGFVIPGIAWQAHLGGLITGAVAAAAIGYLGRAKDPLQPPDRRIHWVALGGLFVVLVLLSVAKYAL
ncbi:rhomboid family intramembrane serine protease [Phycicoccus jejuensis]|uniref:rhomboid family intramembrane serine protease n=1 Tax=Phycicoccus jejuensis TaxID=367299 RepID=UPI001FE0ADFF|nr:rhomboid family intramembrane serine protease [Phycicoccus jejuensis]